MKILLSLMIAYAFSYCGVGFSEISFYDTQRDRTLKTYLWYPSDEPNQEIFNENKVFEGFWATKDAKMSIKNAPLVFLIHGSGGNQKNLSWLAAKLAQDGHVVVSANHPGSTTGHFTPESILNIWEQPKDISFLIQAILTSKYKNHIDASNITAIGFSLGGYSAMALVGAEVQMEKYREFCAIHTTNACKFFHVALKKLDEPYFKQAKESHQDKRIKRAIALAPGFVGAMTQDSLQNITSPVLVIGGENDKNVPPLLEHISILDNHIKHITYKLIKGASHFSFFQKCKDGAKILLKDESFICEDGHTISRDAIHKEIYSAVIDFLHSSR
jgi:predicted dienelactone hydrolase